MTPERPADASRLPCATWLLVAAGFVGGLFGAFFGLGGGVIFVPVLVYFARMPMKSATAASLAVMPALTIASIVTSLISVERGLTVEAAVSWEHALAFGLPAVFGAYLLGVPLAGRIEGAQLKRILGCIQVAAAIEMVLEGRALGPSTHSWPLAAALPCGVVVGMLSGMLGIGGGVIVVPLLVMAFRLEQHAAHITSLAVILPSVIAGTTRAHLSRAAGNQLWPCAGRMSLGALVGAALGYLLALRLEAGELRIAFAGMMLLLGLQMAGVLAWLRTRLRPAPPEEAS